MNLQFAMTGTATRRRTYLRQVGTVGGVALALMAIFAGGIWWSTAREDVGTNAATSQATSTDVGAVTTPSSVSSTPSVNYLYLTSSQEDAEFIRRFTAELNALRMQSGQRPVEAGVLVMNDLDTSVLAVLPRPPGTTVIDLRTP
jgi:hypothetical protein